MISLALGVFLWSAVHFYPSIAIQHRKNMRDALGTAYQGLYSLLIIISILLMILGWKIAVPEQIYSPPIWGRHLTMLLLLLAIILLGAAHTTSHIKQWIRHPMLVAVIIWSIAHLLSNGDSSSLILFGGLGLWAAISHITISRRDGAWEKPVATSTVKSSVILLTISVIIYTALLFLHPYFTGMPVILPA